MENVHSLEWLTEDPLAELNRRKLERLSRGENLIDLSMINPDFEPPSLALDKLAESILKRGYHRYAVSRGVRRLREAFATKWAKCFGVNLDSDQELCVSLGTKDAISLSFACLCATKRRVLVGSPCYPMYRSAARLMGIELDYFKISSDEGFMLDSIRSRLAANSVALLLLNFPNNPTGIAVSADFYRELGGLLMMHDCYVVNDFVYGEMEYEHGHACSLLSEPSLREKAFETYSLSKAYSVPGWRIGALAGVAEVIKSAARLKSHVDYGAFLPLQIAAASLLNASQDLVETSRINYRSRCRLLMRGLTDLGWEVQAPHAGACVWAKLPENLALRGSLNFAQDLLDKTGVVVMPGCLFGQEFDAFVRFALVNNEQRIQELLLRLAGFSYDK